MDVEINRLKQMLPNSNCPLKLVAKEMSKLVSKNTRSTHASYNYKPTSLLPESDEPKLLNDERDLRNIKQSNVVYRLRSPVEGCTHANPSYIGTTQCNLAYRIYKPRTSWVISKSSD